MPTNQAAAYGCPICGRTRCSCGWAPGDFAAIARHYRLASGLSWRAWAKQLGTGLASVLYWERGRVPRKRDEIEARMREVTMQAQRGGQP